MVRARQEIELLEKKVAGKELLGTVRQERERQGTGRQGTERPETEAEEGRKAGRTGLEQVQEIQGDFGEMLQRSSAQRNRN